MDNIALGKYLPLNSIVHRFDPRAKIVAMFILMISIFFDIGWIGHIFMSAFLVFVTLLAKLQLNFIWRAMKPMLFMLSFLLIINLLVVHDGTLLFSIFGWEIYSGAFIQTLMILMRLAYMVIISTVLTATTKPLELTLGIEDLLSPLKVFHVPAHQFAMMISIALRFIPTLIEETQRIMKAQASRGVDLDEGKLMEKIKAMISLIIPLFVSAFQRAIDLADAMEARGYIPDRKRTRYHQLKMGLADYLMLLICIGVLTCAIILQVM